MPAKNAKPGRPRSFDRDAALERATQVFWRYGYEATSIANLTEAMRIRPPSLYAAFGDKRQLFSEVVARYQAGAKPITLEAFARATAREAIEQLLLALADDYTDPAHPPGCLVVCAAVNCTEASADIERELRGHREAGKQAIADRIAADVATGLLQETVKPQALATFYAAVVQGMSTQARDGASRDDVRSIAEQAMAAWPSK